MLDINRNQEIEDGLIEANTRIIIKRLPIGSVDPIELDYNPKQFLDILDSERRARENLERHQSMRRDDNDEETGQEDDADE